jgi:hypothetical protein
MMRIVSICLVSMLLLCTACKDPAPPTVREDVSAVVLVSMQAPDYQFYAFEIRDVDLIKEIQAALREDLQHPQDPNVVCACSTAHYLSLCSPDGEEQYFDLTADDLSYNRTRYQPDETTVIAEKAFTSGLAMPISKEQAERLAPRAARFLKD